METRGVTASDAEEYFALRLRSEQEFPEFVGLGAEREPSVGTIGIAAVLADYPAEGTTVLGGFKSSELIGVLELTRRLSLKYRHKVFLWVCTLCRITEAALLRVSDAGSNFMGSRAS